MGITVTILDIIRPHHMHAGHMIRPIATDVACSLCLSVCLTVYVYALQK